MLLVDGDWHCVAVEYTIKLTASKLFTDNSRSFLGDYHVLGFPYWWLQAHY